ncbi:UNVERIFIED_CONTAM: Leucine-rich repeat receptor protein kinase MSP1 [Sesamum latifolium]|uniref:non-specific serine/threonine protein kinase n=1 Tax=Sesamum latifolium TaxID=2727402 RepID=A0AAW2W9C7_9LAMI
MDQTLQAVLAATASFFVVSLILASILIICKGDAKRRRNIRSVSPDRARNSALPKPNTAPHAGLSSIYTGESATFDPSLNHVSMQELVEVTRNFSPDLIIGDGSFGLVYKARLYSGPVVAVKKLSPDAFQGLREFRAEMETCKIRHPNIVKILGYCATGSDRVLIYEFIEKGSLDQWLYDTSSEEDYDALELRLPLSWHTRMKIIRGVAKGLAFMHNLDTPIIHRDIKASNILLDANFEAHIADFGLARRIEGSHSHVSTQVAGTMGYMPPEYLHGATMATVVGDVYSFGVLMLEIVGKEAEFSIFW